MIEGACDEIAEASEGFGAGLTSPQSAARYLKETGVDMIVANLGTEHRASAAALKYHGELAREIKEVCGTKIVLHGASSVGNEQIKGLFSDGICKVNIWTVLERESGKKLFGYMVKDCEKAAGPALAEKLMNEGYLTGKCRRGNNIDIGYFTAAYRNGVMFTEIKSIVADYLKLWYITK